jgi:hypothetical protein
MRFRAMVAAAALIAHALISWMLIGGVALAQPAPQPVARPATAAAPAITPNIVVQAMQG